jgi:hypothetical protein
MEEVSCKLALTLFYSLDFLPVATYFVRKELEVVLYEVT